jgi:hypothetical protein
MLSTYNRLCGIPHNRFGGRAGETELPKGGHRALVRSHPALLSTATQKDDEAHDTPSNGLVSTPLKVVHDDPL